MVDAPSRPPYPIYTFDKAVHLDNALARSVTTALLLALAVPGGTVVRAGSQQPQTFVVSTDTELQAAMSQLRPGAVLTLTPGTYRLSRPLDVPGHLSDVTIRSATGNAADVTLLGRGMSSSSHEGVPYGIAIQRGAQRIAIIGITLRDFFEHGVVIHPGVIAPRLTSLRIVNTGRALIAARAESGGRGVNDGILETSVLEYTAAARDAGSGGIDVTAGTGWRVRNNLFRNIQAPTGQVSGPAVLFGASADAVIEANLFLNCQREIWLGNGAAAGAGHSGVTVVNNAIHRAPAVRGDVSILLSDAANVRVLHNTVVVNDASINPIEYRGRKTKAATIRNNLLDGEIVSRDGATAAITPNHTRAEAAFFANASAGDLRLTAAAAAIIDATAALAEVPTDLEGQQRPQGGAADFGADEFPGGLAVLADAIAAQPSSPTPVLSPAPATGGRLQESRAAVTATLPAPWESIDIGSGKAGSSSWNAGTFAITAGGVGLAGNADQFRFVYVPLDGDGEIVARLDSIDKSSPRAHAGITIRESLTTGAKHAALVVTANGSVLFDRRIATGAMTTETNAGSGKAPLWLKVVRAGDTFTAFRSTDNVKWSVIGTEILYLKTSVYVGLVVASKSAKALTTARISNVGVTVSAPANQAPTVRLAEPTAGASFANPCTIQLTAVASDSDGAVKRVDFYAGATMIGSRSAAPFSVPWSTVPTGKHVLKAVAFDDKGASAASPTVEVDVQPPPAVANQPPIVSLTSPTAGEKFTAPATIALAASASDADGLVAKVEFYDGDTLLSADTSAPYSFTWSGVAAGTHALSARVWDSAGAWTRSAIVSVAVDSGTPWPVEWSRADVGQPAVAGSATPSVGGFQVSGAGSGIGEASDQFHFVYQQFSGDGAITACVSELDFVNEWSSAGVMFRENLNGDSPNAFAFISAGWGAVFKARASQAGLTEQAGTAPAVAPHCIRLVRNGHQFHAHESQDATSWKEISSRQIVMPETVFVGLAVSSHRASSAATATFRNVAVAAAPPNAPPAVTLTQPTSGGTTQSAPATLTLSASASDPEGRLARVDFYVAGVLVGTDSTAPYSVSWSTSVGGTFPITAVAVDDKGASATSAPVTITIAGTTTALPHYLGFQASADHDVNVVSYRVEFFAAGSDPSSTSPVRFMNIGKPTPVAGEVTVDIQSTVQALPAGSYFITVTAFGPAGETRSSPTETFVR